jgi:hypothetical protein
MKIAKIKTEDVKNLSDTLKEKKSRIGTTI